MDGVSLLIEGIGAVPGLSVYLSRESTICAESNIGIAGCEAELGVVFAQVGLNLIGSNLATCLSQQIF